MFLTARQIWRNWVTDGVESSGEHEPQKPEIRNWGTWVEGVISAFTSNGGLVYSTLALLNADLAHDVKTMAWVIGDPVAANNGVYSKVGASGTGSWTRVADLPYSYISATDVGAGTANAIQATTEIPVSESALITLNIFETTGAGPVTVSFNGETALTVKTNSGNNPATAGLVAGMIVLGFISGSTFRLVNDQVSSAIVAAAEAAQTAAAASAVAAAASAAGVNLPAIAGGDKGKILVVNADETGYQLMSPNQRLAKTAAYTVVDADYMQTIALGGNAGYALTFNAANTYRSNFTVRVVNEDTARGKKMTINGLTTFILWPGQCVTVFNQNNVWKVDPAAQRFAVSGVSTVYVDPTNGNDANDGLAAGSGNALATIQKAVTNIRDFWDCRATQVTVQLAAGTYTPNAANAAGFIVQLLQQLTGVNQLIIIGDVVTPANVVWNASANGQTLLQVRDYGTVTVKGVTFGAGAFTGCTFLSATQMGIVDHDACVFGACLSGNHIKIADMGAGNGLGGYSITGNCSAHILIIGPSNYTQAGAVTINLPTARTWSTAFLQMIGGFYNSGNVTYSGTGAGAGSTGQKYSIQLNGAASLGGSTLPGASAGAVATGGQAA